MYMVNVWFYSVIDGCNDNLKGLSRERSQKKQPSEPKAGERAFMGREKGGGASKGRRCEFDKSSYRRWVSFCRPLPLLSLLLLLPLLLLFSDGHGGGIGVCRDRGGRDFSTSP